MREIARWRNIGLNEPVDITLPASIWVGSVAGYIASDWAAEEPGSICDAIQEAMLDPVWLRERQAEMQEREHNQNADLSSFLGIRSPEVPPNAEGIDT